MITTKQRAVLRSLCNTLDPVLQVGKEGITEGTIMQANALFEARELFKIKVLNNSDMAAREVARQLAEKTHCDIVQCIGNKVSVYRRSTRKDVKHIELI